MLERDFIKAVIILKDRFGISVHCDLGEGKNRGRESLRIKLNRLDIRGKEKEKMFIK